MNTSNSDAESGIQTNNEFEIAVVGCGMAGLCAGMRAAQEGKDVVILEKSPKGDRGGQTQYTESWRIPTAEIDLDLDFDVPDYTSDDFFRDIMETSQYQSDRSLVRTLTNEAGDAFEWLTEQLSTVGFEWRTEPLRSMYTAGRVWHDGKELVDALVNVTETHGVEIVYNAEAQELYRSGSRQVEGIDAVVSDQRVRFLTDAVVIACGGFESSPERRAQYLGGDYDQMKVRGVKYNTGEAIEMALDIGAKSAGHWSGAHMSVIDAGSPDVGGGQTLVSGYQYGLILNHDGERFVDEGEDVRAKTYAKFGKEIFKQPYREAFVVHDSVTNERVFHTGPTDPITAESIEQLVSRLDIGNPTRAIETIEEYNESCSPGGFDPEKLDGCATEGISPPKSNWAKPLTEPPFVGYPVTGGITFTFGGLAQTSRSEVLDTSDRPIPGLYAAGNVTGGLIYENYPGSTALTNAAVFGRIAGEQAAQFGE
jgi:tricarballylate dehydrogenase